MDNFNRMYSTVSSKFGVVNNSVNKRSSSNNPKRFVLKKENEYFKKIENILMKRSKMPKKS